MPNNLTTFEYGAMSSKYSCQAENKLTAYVAMCLHFDSSSHLIALYAPEEIKKDSWLSFTGQISARLDEVFKESSGLTFDEYVDKHVDEIKKCYKSIKQLI